MASDEKRPMLSKIKEKAWQRGLALARVSVSAGAQAAGHAMGTAFASDEKKAAGLKKLLTSQMGLLTKELGQLKGSVMKVGQMLSMYGEHFLPPEANVLLKSLQNQSPPLAWAEIEKVLRRELAAERLAELDIDPVPAASASLGQVHRARRRSDGAAIALKIQYPGVDRAIDSDLKALRSLLGMAKLLPKGPQFDELFAEVKVMLEQEVDYRQELRLTEEYRAQLEAAPALAGRYVIPRTYPEYSTSRVMATSWEEGVAVDGPEVQALPPERRNDLARLALDLYFHEIFRFGMMQTDPHFGNYRVRLGDPDRLVLFDFGAVRKIDPGFMAPYSEMIRGSFNQDARLLWRGAQRLGYLKDGDAQELLDHFAKLCFMITSPFHEGAGVYDWGTSDLPRKVVQHGAQMALAFQLRPPPREIVFLDRKMGGIFFFLSVLRARIDGREALRPFL